MCEDTAAGIDRNDGRVFLTARLIHYLHVYIHKRQESEQQH